MPASKKRIKLRGPAAAPPPPVPAALRDWVHVWHGVRVAASGGPIFHAGSRLERLAHWQRLLRLPNNSLFARVATQGNPRRRYKDFLYVLLNLRWPTLAAVLLGVFVANVLGFALVVMLGCGEPDDYLRAFDLSYQTFTTIGFGVVFPRRTCSNIVMTVESFASMLVTSAITGLVFAKFAKPIAKIAFSKVCVVQPYGHQRLALVVRVANATQSRDVTHDVIMEANVKLNLLRVERAKSTTRASGGSGGGDHSGHSDSDDDIDSDKVLCSYNLKVLQNNFITFRMGVAVVHVIDDESPFFGLSEGEIRASDMLLEVAISGVDSTLQDTVADRFIYTASDLKWGYRFAELLDFDERNLEVIMDFAKLSSVEPAPIDAAKYVQPAAAAAARRSTATCAATDTASHSSPDAGAELEPIDELGAEDPEVFRKQRASSDGAGLAMHVLRRASSKCSLGMEPLFEPLLRQPVGTQRIPVGGGTGATAASTSVASEQVRRRQRLQSGPGALDRGSGATAAAEFLLPVLQKQQLQTQLAGGSLHSESLNDDDDEMSTISDIDGDMERGGVSGGPYEEYQDDTPDQWGGGANPRPSRVAQSVASIDVEDTPRFLKIAPLNIPKSFDFMRLYHSALYVRWPRIILLFVLAFLAINLTFALLYWLKKDDIVWYPEVTLSDFELAFSMSVHTLATIGYGSVAPKPESVYMNFWVFVESSLGIVATTIITGIAWSKFARPRAHIHFSAKIAICRIYGHRCLVFRAANTRHSGDVHENFFRIGVILTNRKTGLRQMYDVPLVTAEWPSIKLPATLIHIIDARSPFFKFHTVADLSESRVAVIALLTGLDTTFSENVYARKMYFWDDFTCDMRFADFARLERDCVVVDYARFDRLVPEASVHGVGETVSSPTLV
ncbi:hypothetical protein PybrP1_009446 [[Pythium] brassicae (nom. inval.)]|nr:hypothetical protein PybrP1_009446 [[Pythium] brassicae (nom. inval.)]